MTTRTTLFAIAGSTRQHSTNHHLLKAIALLFADQLEMVFSDSIATLPHFSPDYEADDAPYSVVQFRQGIRNADGVIICTPEYAHGVPGTLKNAIDWTIGSGDFSHKPTALITAGTDGRFGHAALLETLRVIEAENIDALQLLIPFAKTKIAANDTITDPATLTQLRQLIRDLLTTISAPLA